MDIVGGFDNIYRKTKTLEDIFSKSETNTENYQVYAQRYFDLNSNKLRWVILDYGTGVGKTLTSLLMLQNQFCETIIIGNSATKISFNNEIEKQPSLFKANQFDFMTYQTMQNFKDEQMLKYFAGKIIIVDEFQNLYSQDGLNLWGKKLQYLCKNMLRNTKVVGLSGTLLNTIWQELCYVINIFKGQDVYDPLSPQLQKEKLLKEVDGHILSYHDIDPTQYPDAYYCYGMNNNIQEVKKSVYDFKIFPVVSCPMTQQQTQKEEEEWQHLQQVQVFQAKNNLAYRYFYNPARKQPLSNEIIKGDDILLENLKKYAPVSSFLISDIIKGFKTKRIGKIAIYNENTNSMFGLEQLKLIFQNNGFIIHGNKIQNDTLCIRCGIQHSDHGNSHNFIPATFIMYTSNLQDRAREEVLQIYNSFKNKDGNVVDVIMLSGIAETGISLAATNYMYLMDAIPGLSQYMQIVARTIRKKSHIDIPDRNYVKVYNLLPSEFGKQTSAIIKHQQDIFIQGLEANHMMERVRESFKFDDKVVSNTYHDSDDIQYLQTFVSKLYYMQSTTMDNMMKLMRDKNLLETPFDIKHIDDKQLQRVIQRYYFDDGEGKLFRNLFEIYQMNISRNYNNFQWMDVELEEAVGKKGKEVMFIDTIKDKYNISQSYVKHYIKIYKDQLIQRIDSLILGWDTIFSAYFIWDGFVYMQDDDRSFVSNHKKLWQEIYNKQFSEIYKNQKRIVDKFNIKGVYFKKKVLLKNFDRNIKQLKPIDNIVIFQSTKDFPRYQIGSRDLYVYYNEYIEESGYKREEFEELNKFFKSRWNLLYFYNQDAVQGFVVPQIKK